MICEEPRGRFARGWGEDEAPTWFLDVLDGLRRLAAREARSTREGFAAASQETLGLDGGGGGSERAGMVSPGARGRASGSAGES